MNTVKQTIIKELQELLPKSKHYADHLETAKTEIKKRIMKKRLKKNNMRVADLLIVLDRINKQEAKNGDDNAERRVAEESTSEKSAD